jgi:hypothetical protein
MDSTPTEYTTENINTLLCWYSVLWYTVLSCTVTECYKIDGFSLYAALHIIYWYYWRPSRNFYVPTPALYMLFIVDIQDVPVIPIFDIRLPAHGKIPCIPGDHIRRMRISRQRTVWILCAPAVFSHCPASDTTFYLFTRSLLSFTLHLSAAGGGGLLWLDSNSCPLIPGAYSIIIWIQGWVPAYLTLGTVSTRRSPGVVRLRYCQLPPVTGTIVFTTPLACLLNLPSRSR